MNQVMCYEKNRTHSFYYLVTVRMHTNLSKQSYNGQLGGIKTREGERKYT